MSAVPGTEAFGQQLARECELITFEMDSVKEFARRLAKGQPSLKELGGLLNGTPGGRILVADMLAYNAKVAQHREAIRRERQAQANQDAAAKTQAASCKSCFTVHGPAQAECH